METEVIQAYLDGQINEQGLRRGADILKEGGLVAFPTETVYGLGGNSLDETAARRIYQAKGRPSDNPLIAHISDRDMLDVLVSGIPAEGQLLMDRFWPGPLTLVFEKSDQVPLSTTGGLQTVAVRMPSDPVARLLIRLAGVPVAAPSANLSGRPSPTTAQHVCQDMNGKIPMIVDGGQVGIGVESTIVDLSGPVPVLLRPGAVTLEMLSQVLDRVEVDPAILGPVSPEVKPKAPGMKYRHYAPKAELFLVEGKQQDVERAINRMTGEKLALSQSVGIICTEESRQAYSQGIVKSVGFRGNQESIAHNLYLVLRQFDDLGVDYIFSESFSSDSLGQAIMNRLSKAAGYRVCLVSDEAAK